MIEPADEEAEIRHDPFYVRGRFKVVQKANASRQAGLLYDSADVR